MLNKLGCTDHLLSILQEQTMRDVQPGIKALAEAARACHGESVRAVLFYGSCLRTDNLHDGLADLYLLVDDYHSAFKGRTLALFNQLLPPNVFYLEVPFEGHLLRAKYAVLTLDDFQKGTSLWFHSYLWGRFSQRCGLVYAHDEKVTCQVEEALAGAVATFVSKTLPRLKTSFTARELWGRGLSLSYRAELRTEQADAAARLFDVDPGYYEELTDAALENTAYILSVEANSSPHRYQVQIPSRDRRLNEMGWRVRTIQGKILSVLRLLKGLFTFKGGVDYIQWKIERHSGARVEVGPTLKRLPALAVVVIFWRLFRRGAFR